MPLAAGRAEIPLGDETNIGDCHVGKITDRIDVRIVIVLFVRARDGVLHPHCRLVNDDMRPLLDADGTHKTGASPRCTDGGFIRHAQLASARHGVREFHLVDLVIAAQEGEDEHVLLRLIRYRLDRLFDGNLEELREQCDRARVRGRDLLKGKFRLIRRVEGTQLRLLIARRIAACITAGNARLALGREHGELLGTSAADRAAVRLHRAEVQSAARKDIRIRLVHLAVGFVHSLDVLVK